ncbi:hypothetical protein DCC62_14425 [candidate division KSB1 bacterium]|nr:MAG: hypothetical protein DCC62_14425 [candidate division KSB1 bacterium]
MRVLTDESCVFSSLVHRLVQTGWQAILVYNHTPYGRGTVGDFCEEFDDAISSHFKIHHLLRRNASLPNRKSAGAQ